jgi:hypothetical protein
MNGCTSRFFHILLTSVLIFVPRYGNSQQISALIIKIHHNELVSNFETKPLDCPSATCAEGDFNILELYNHLILVHSIPMAGIRHKKKSTNTFPTLTTLDDLATQPKRKICGTSIHSPSVHSSPSVCHIIRNIMIRLHSISGSAKACQEGKGGRNIHRKHERKQTRNVISTRPSLLCRLALLQLEQNSAFSVK